MDEGRAEPGDEVAPTEEAEVPESSSFVALCAMVGDRLDGIIEVIRGHKVRLEAEGWEADHIQDALSEVHSKMVETILLP